jgi:hypothetical protein
VTDLHLQIDEPGLALFLPLLGKGVLLPARTGCSVREFCCKRACGSMARIFNALPGAIWRHWPAIFKPYCSRAAPPIPTHCFFSPWPIGKCI